MLSILRGHHFALESMFPDEVMTLDVDDFGVPPTLMAYMGNAAPDQIDTLPGMTMPKTSSDGALTMSAAAKMANMTVAQFGALTVAEANALLRMSTAMNETRIDGELSLEDQRELICDEVCEALGRGFYAYIVATGSKAVVYCRLGGYDYDYDDVSYWRQEYSINGETVELQGEPQPYMLTFAPAPASAGDGEESAMDPKLAERLDRLAGAVEAMVGVDLEAHYHATNPH